MSEIAPISRPDAPPQIRGAERQGRAKNVVATPPRGSDKVELSTAAQLLSQLSKLPDVRPVVVGRIEQIRNQIADGTYETSDKIDAVIQNIADDLV